MKNEFYTMIHYQPCSFFVLYQLCTLSTFSLVLDWILSLFITDPKPTKFTASVAGKWPSQLINLETKLKAIKNYKGGTQEWLLLVSKACLVALELWSGRTRTKSQKLLRGPFLWRQRVSQTSRWACTRCGEAANNWDWRPNT